ncbi:hypothetical protein CR203_23365 [Salipaludibacillus neizhouensis]|uniref:Uncharacterized protein n=1 Tax=Salipaludibacillus neizhouensis TaxID=885475 RepID=A0A3A9K207_9BACI|nr:hypothetical protein [Salipaludibacillus neizhouensis]RKL64950.1 hypothetical protein CR203_23365 [Salipaludibacillus neizhouensis]
MIEGKHYELKFSEETIFTNYLRSISKSFCPFLGPSENKNLLYATQYSLSGSDIKELQSQMFYYGVIHTEKLRKMRRSIPNKGDSLLVCENVIFKLPEELQCIDGKELFSWPHWTLKTLYTDVGVMFGKFWVGEKDTSRDNIPITEPPSNFFSIRSAIKTSDPYFFKKAPQLLPTLINSFDDVRDIHTHLLPGNCSIDDFQSMNEHNYYDVALEWAKKFI